VNQENQKRQRLLKILVLTSIAVAVLIYSGFVISEYLDSKNGNQITYTSLPHLPMDGVNPQEIWVDQIRQENEIVQEKVNYIQELMVNNLKEDDAQKNSTQQEIIYLRSEIEAMKAELKENQNALIIPRKEALREELYQASMSNRAESWNQYPSFNQTEIQPEMQAPLSSVDCPEPINLHHIDCTIPSGTTVKAILLSSVDLPCGVKGGSDPLPVKLRIIADGRLSHAVRARLKSGIVTASVYGDLSSERGYFRLEKLVQVRADGHYIETVVAGYISGEDGKYGLRGVVVDKSAQLIESALLTGFLSGASDFFQAASTARLFPACGHAEGNHNPNWRQSAGQLAIAGGSEGVTNAMDALTDYFIKRAEQLRPVIQITPGRIVDITFLESADLGDLYTHERVKTSGAT